MPSSPPTANPPGVPELQVHTPDGRVLRFTQPFRIGRDHDCDLRLNDAHVSRKHAEGSCEKGTWIIRDLKSANGLVVDGRRVSSIRVEPGLTLSLGTDGPSLTFDLDGKWSSAQPAPALPQTIAEQASETRLLASLEERYFGSGAAPERAGGRTMMIRRAFDRVRRKQQRRYWWALGALGVALLATAGVAYYKHRQLLQERANAEALFYTIKALDVNIANLERLIAQSGSAEARDLVAKYRAQRRAAESMYEELFAVRRLYDAGLSEEDRLILRVTRSFGECELAASSDYMTNIKAYIRRWQSSQRFVQAVSLAEQKGFTRAIAEEFVAHNLPPEFFYLALQESNFNEFTSGPPTAWGIAKGMWQFIPETAERYGLKIGPLVRVPQPDPADDRHNWKKATGAAARYIKDIYSTDAQASGLLVMASYNWGEGRVVKLVRSLPENPRERNFWKLVEQYRHRIPKETYDYVFYIVSAAVIGQNPRLFGLPLDNPLGFLEARQAGG